MLFNAGSNLVNPQRHRAHITTYTDHKILCAAGCDDEVATIQNDCAITSTSLIVKLGKTPHFLIKLLKKSDHHGMTLGANTARAGCMEG